MEGLGIFQDLFTAAIAVGTPILFTALGEIVTEKSLEVHSKYGFMRPVQKYIYNAYNNI